jgi:hypothetical protein
LRPGDEVYGTEVAGKVSAIREDRAIGQWNTRKRGYRITLETAPRLWQAATIGSSAIEMEVREG